MPSIDAFGKKFVVKYIFDDIFFYYGSFCLHPSHCHNAFGQLLKTRVFSKGDWVSKRSSGVWSLPDIYFRCNVVWSCDTIFFLPRKVAFFSFCTLLCQISHVLSNLVDFFWMEKYSPLILWQFDPTFWNISWKLVRVDFFTPMSVKSVRNLRRCHTYILHAFTHYTGWWLIL